MNGRDPINSRYIYMRRMRIDTENCLGIRIHRTDFGHVHGGVGAKRDLGETQVSARVDQSRKYRKTFSVDPLGTGWDIHACTDRRDLSILDHDGPILDNPTRHRDDTSIHDRKRSGTSGLVLLRSIALR